MRRLFRQIEEVQSDSRVGNLKGRYADLVKKIKIRDHFEHGVDPNTLPDFDPAQAPKVIDVPPDGPSGIKVSTSLMNGVIISGSLTWDINKDHQIFIKMLNEFASLYPFDVQSPAQKPMDNN